MNNSSPKIIFFGNPDFAVPALEKLIENNYNVVAIFTGQDKPIGRKQILTPSPVKAVAIKHGLEIFQPKTLKDEQVFGQFKALTPDLCIIVAYNKIIPKNYIDLPKYGFINIHPSLLPKYRGPSPIQSAILNNEKETGVSIMLIDEEVDHGPVLKSIKYLVSGIKYFKEIHDELAELGANLLIETLPDYLEGKIEPQKQNHAEATFTKKLEREDGKINWNRPAKEIYNQIRALNPDPGTWTTWEDEIFNILRAKPINNKTSADPGTVDKIDGQIAVACLDSYLTLDRVQLAGKKEMTAKDFLNGHSDFLNSKLG